MVQRTTDALSELYETDETAWLDEMAERIGTRQLDELDYPHLQELLEDIARSDRREVENRLAILIMHVLKGTHQPENRTPSWRRTITEQRQQLIRLL